jgi:tyrosinase
MYVGGNKMPFPSVSPQDPMFWLHHANVDRIWSIWQAMRPGVDPPLVGADATMDPWAQTVSDVLDTYNLWYYYA